MSKQSYISLHNHSDYSILKSSLTIEELLQNTHKQGHTAVALTDYHSLAGIPEFCARAKSMGIKPIIGCELTVDLTQDLSPFKLPEQLANKTILDRLLVYCINETGYKNLCKILAASKEYNLTVDELNTSIIGTPPLRERVIPINALQSYKAGLLFVYGGMRSRIYTDILENRLEPKDCIELYLGRYSKALLTPTQPSWLDDLLLDPVNLMEYFKCTPQEANFFLNMQFHDRPEETELNRILVTYAKKNGIPMVASADVHYSNKDDHDRLIEMECIRTSNPKNSETLLNHPISEYYFHSNEEMLDLFFHLPEAIENTNIIANRCNYTLNLEQESELWPVLSIPNGQGSAVEYLKKLVYERLPSRYSDPSPHILSQVEYELEIFAQMRVLNYLLFVQDFIHSAHEQGFLTTPGRGASGGSILCYILKITDVCPVQNNLHFERFLNPERVAMGIIEPDFSEKGRLWVTEYLTAKYGKDHISLLSAYNKFKEDHPSKCKGLIRAKEIHAAGFILSSEKLSSIIPLDNSAGALSCTQYDKTHIEELGFLKQNVFSLAYLDVVEMCTHVIQKNTGDTITFNSIPLDDPHTFELFSQGKTDGIFLFESKGIRSYLQEMQPRSLTELTNLNAMYRPDLMNYLSEYIGRKSESPEQKKLHYWHKHLEPILLETNGMIIYQEQIMSILQIIGGYSLAKADIVRRQMALKKQSTLPALYAEFEEISTKRGYAVEWVKKLWEQLLVSSAFALNKSHYLSYALMAYRCAWLKTNFPEEYQTSYDEVFKDE